MGLFIFFPIAASLGITGCVLLISLLSLWSLGFGLAKFGKTTPWVIAGFSALLACSVIYWRLLNQRRSSMTSLVLDQYGVRYNAPAVPIR